MAIWIQGDEGVVEINSVGAWAMVKPRPRDTIALAKLVGDIARG
jgi:hypothetical protein